MEEEKIFYLIVVLFIVFVVAMNPDEFDGWDDKL